jgi:hypothetical protein
MSHRLTYQVRQSMCQLCCHIDWRIKYVSRCASYVVTSTDISSTSFVVPAMLSHRLICQVRHSLCQLCCHIDWNVKYVIRCASYAVTSTDISSTSFVVPAMLSHRLTYQVRQSLMQYSNRCHITAHCTIYNYNLQILKPTNALYYQVLFNVPYICFGSSWTIFRGSTLHSYYIRWLIWWYNIYTHNIKSSYYSTIIVL